jgi:CheY-like chemotaxis protein
MIVDDEAAVRRVVRTCLERNGYAVLEAGSGEEALTIYGGDGQAVELVVSDVRMPGMDGNELVRRIRAINPAQRILFVTAYPGDVDEDGAHRNATLAKPFSATQLLRNVVAQLSRAVAV